MFIKSHRPVQHRAQSKRALYLLAVLLLAVVGVAFAINLQATSQASRAKVERTPSCNRRLVLRQSRLGRCSSNLSRWQAQTMKAPASTTSKTTGSHVSATLQVSSAPPGLPRQPKTTRACRSVPPPELPPIIRAPHPFPRPQQLDIARPSAPTKRWLPQLLFI